MVKNTHFKIAAPFILIIISLLIYLPSLKGGFVWDDHLLIEKNAHVQSLSSLPKALMSGFFPSQGSEKPSYFRPMITASYALDFSLWKYRPFGYHLTNIILNILVCLLVYAAALVVLKDVRAAFAAALIFAAHPTHAESVAWVSGRTDIIAALFILPSFIFYAKHIAVKADRKWLILSAVFMLLALLSKEAAIVFPAVWLLYGFAKKRETRKLLIDAVAFFAAAVVYWAIYRRVDIAPIADQFVLPLQYRLIAVPENFFTAMRLTYLPVIGEPYHRIVFSVLYSMKRFAVEWLMLAFGILAFVRLWQRSRVAAFTVAWVILGIWPVLNLVQLTRPILAERLLYLGTIGSSLGFGLIVRHLLASRPKVSIALGAVVVLLTAGWSAGAFLGAKPWQSDLALWSRITAITDKDHRGERFWTYERAEYYANLSASQYERKQYRAAAASAKMAMDIQPKFYRAYVAAGSAYGVLGMEKECLQAYKTAMTLFPDMPQVVSNYGAQLVSFGHPAEAIAYFEMAINMDPQMTDPYVNLGVAYTKMGKYDKACDYYGQAVELMPKNPVFRLSYGNALLRLNRNAEAAEQFRYVIQEIGSGPEVSVAENLLKKAENAQ